MGESPATLDEIRTWPALVPLSQAARALNIGRTTAFTRVARGEFPVPVVRALGARTSARPASSPTWRPTGVRRRDDPASVLIAAVGFPYVRHRWRLWRLMRHEAAKLRAHGAAKTRRPVLQRLLSALPLTLSRTVPLALRGPDTFVHGSRGARPPGPLGRRERIRLTQHILLAGQTGSGKSSTQRVIAAHVLQAADACLEVWDLKRISALRDYRSRARTCVTAGEVSARLRDLVGREFTERADRLIAGQDVPYLVVLVDEAVTTGRGCGSPARSCG
ncbi:hypothetical protein ACFVYV_40300 [Streptomyces mirabilis]|uniref:hypothetical protein n=1 Tax=Streptomyces mirabilis TaxID=68239 RepID=UPI0036DE0E26